MTLAYRYGAASGPALIAGVALSLGVHLAVANYGIGDGPLPEPDHQRPNLQGREFIDLAPVEMLAAAPQNDLPEGPPADDSQAAIQSPEETARVKAADTPLLAQTPYQPDDPELSFRIATPTQEDEENHEATQIPTEIQEETVDQGAVESRAAAPAASAGQDRKSGATEEEIGLSAQDTARINAWQKELVLAIAAAKTYPRAARTARASGTVTVAFTLDQRGSILGASILESSGWPVLDSAALALVDGFDRLPAPPAAMGPGPFDLRMPVSYVFR